MLQRILAAVDDSPRAPHVVEAAVERARWTKAELRVFHAIAIPPEFPAAAHTSGDPLPAHMRKVALERLHALLDPIQDVHWELKVDEAHRAAHAILAAAAEYHPDLVVIGSHGYDALDRLLGTTAAKVVNLSHIDVLVVHRSG